MLLISVLLFLLTFAIVYFQLPFLIRFMIKRGKVGIDVHKENKPSVAEMGGISIILAVTLSFIILFVLTNNPVYLVILSTGLIAGIIGLIDDLKDLGGKIKPVLTLLAAAPILITGSYNPRPAMPFLPSTRLTLAYPILIPTGIAITSNAVNMLDVINGATPLLLLPILISMLVVAFLFAKESLIPILVILIASLLAFYFYNKYPAKTFMGNCGDFFLGSILGALAIVYSLEIFVIVAMLPYIMNGFYALSSVGRLFEKKEIKEKPVRVVNGLLYASTSKEAPMTLMRMILIKGPLSEKQVANLFFYLSCISSILAILTELLSKVRLF